MIIHKIIGKLADWENHHDGNGLIVERVILSWDELHKKIMRKTTDKGRDIGIQLASGHLHPGDILFREGEHVIVVEVEEAAVLVVPVRNMREMGTAAHAIGNLHAPIQINQDAIITPYNPVLQEQLQKLGLTSSKEARAFAP